MSEMEIKDEKRVLCAANSYEEKYYFNPRFNNIPQQIKDELQIMCVLFTDEIGGILLLQYDASGNLLLKTVTDENDFYYDEIEAGLAIRNLQKEKEELLQTLELYYQTFFREEIS